MTVARDAIWEVQLPKDKNSREGSKKTSKTTAAKAKQAKKQAAKSARVAKVVSGAKEGAIKLATNPAVAEVVAAALVATAAAIKNPNKARNMAAAVGDELQAASKQSAESGGAFWQLALDVARRSIDALGAETKARKAKPAKKKAKK